MTDNVPIKDATDATQTIATDDVGGAQYQYVKPAFGADGTATPVSSANPLPVDVGSLPLAADASTATKQDAILAALAGLGDAVAAVTAAVQATGAVYVSNFPATQPVSGTVTVANPVSTVAVSNLPATQPVSGTVAVSNLPTTQAVSGTVTVGNASLAVTGPATNAELRAAALPVSLASAPLPSDAATQTTLAALLASANKVRPAQTHAAVTLDATISPPTSALRFDAAGTVVIQDTAGTSATYTVLAGEVMPIAASKVVASGTTVSASAIKAWWN